MDLSESLEDYLLAIADLAGPDPENPASVHSGEVAVRVDVSNASVTHAFRALRERGLIEYQRYQAVHLTEAGRLAASQVLARKQALIRFFSNVLELEPSEAEHNAHRIEHVITPNAVQRLEELVDELDGRDGVGREVSASRERPDRTDR